MCACKLTAASRTPPGLPSGSGGRGRRLPEGEEVLVSCFRFGCVAGERIGTGKAETSQRCYRRIPRYTPVIQDLLELLRRVSALLRSQIGLSTQVNGVEKE